MVFDQDKLNEEYWKKLEEIYKSELGGFKKYLIGILLASIIFASIIFFPYLESIKTIDSLNDELDQYNGTSFKNFVKSYDKVLQGIDGLKDPSITIQNNLGEVIENLFLFETKLLIQKTLNATNLILSTKNIDPTNPVVLNLTGSIKPFAANFVITPYFYQQISNKCSQYVLNIKQLCMWNDIFLNSSEFKSNINNTAILYPLCNNNHLDYVTSENISKEWADCILNQLKHKHLVKFEHYYNSSISNYLYNMTKEYFTFNEEIKRTPDKNIINNLTNLDKKIKNVTQVIDNNDINVFTNKTFTNSIPNDAGIDEGIQIYFRESLDNTNSYIETVRDQLSNLTNELKVQKIDREIATTLKEIDNTRDRLIKSQFPLVSFPLELDSTVAIFPIALAIGIFICLRKLPSAMDARIDLRKCYEIKDPTKSIYDDKEFNRIYPLWICESDSGSLKAIKSSIIAIPLIICITISYFVLSAINDYYTFTEGIRSIFGDFALLIYLLLYEISIFIIVREFSLLMRRIWN